jgi:hypothetical protein
VRRGAAILVLVMVLGACSARPHHATATAPAQAAPGATQSASGVSQSAPGSTRSAPPDPGTAAALVRIAQVFNNDYDRNNDGPVYDRWDARSQAVISRAEYIRRHTECPTAPQVPAHVEDATRGTGGAWLVHYEIGGQQLTDYWYYVGRRWVFDLLFSNPSAAQLYRLPFAKYAARAGCPDH